MWLERYRYIKDQYYNQSKNKTEIITQLNELVNKENIDIIWPELPAKLKQVVHQYSLGTTSNSFSERRWNNMWCILISEDFHFQELITHNTSRLTVRFPANHRFKVHHNFIARLKLLLTEPFPDEFDIRICKGTLLAPLCDYMLADEKLNCIPLNFEQFRDQNIPKVYLSKGLFDTYYLIIQDQKILKHCYAKFNKVEVSSN